MELSRRHVVVKAAYWYSDGCKPRQVSLCVLFWRAMWGVVLAVALVAAACAFLTIAVIGWRTVLAVALGLGLSGLFVLGFDSLRMRVRARRSERRGPGLVATAYDGIKHRFCPIVRLVDHGSES